MLGNSFCRDHIMIAALWNITSRRHGYGHGLVLIVQVGNGGNYKTPDAQLSVLSLKTSELQSVLHLDTPWLFWPPNLITNNPTILTWSNLIPCLKIYWILSSAPPSFPPQLKRLSVSGAGPDQVPGARLDLVLVRNGGNGHGTAGGFSWKKSWDFHRIRGDQQWELTIMRIQRWIDLRIILFAGESSDFDDFPSKTSSWKGISCDLPLSNRVLTVLLHEVLSLLWSPQRPYWWSPQDIMWSGFTIYWNP